MAKTLRVHSLAKELGLTSKRVIEKCHAEGIELKNHMAAVSVGLAESIREWFCAGADVTSVEVAEHVDVATIEKVARKQSERKKQVASDERSVSAAIAEPEAITDVCEEPAAAPVETIAAAPAAVDAPVAEEAEEAEETPSAAPIPEETDVPEEADVAVLADDDKTPAADDAEPPPAPPAEPAPVPEPIAPAGPKLVPAPAELRGPRVVRIEAPEPVRELRPRPRPRPAAFVPGPRVDRGGPVPPPSTGRPPPGRKRGSGGGDADSSKSRSRSPRRSGRPEEVTERIKDWRDQDLLERKERLAKVTGHGLKERRAAEQRRRAAVAASSLPGARKTPVEISTPIAVKDFCSAVGAPFSTVSKLLMDHTSQLWSINESLDAEVAEMVALDLGVSVTVARQKGALETLQETFEQRERLQLTPRPPVVAMLGHVDHGKTSLLDAIRRTDVVAGEAGGITQHIGAYRIERDGWRVTFLDTPGHAAFTAMRARGANLTDVVVLVVAADDGVMPQTEEALNHARAAGVQIVVALNKIDLPNADIDRVYGQLAQHELAPSEWGGDTDVIKTSATKGEGIDELIAHLSTLSELLDLKADQSVPAHATVIEAQRREGRGNVAQVLVREGTLRPGQIIVCGAAAGRVRVLRDDRGRTVKEALPGTPVEVCGLDALPRTGDQLYQVDDLKQAKAVAAETQQRLRVESLDVQKKPRTLEDLLAVGDDSQVPQLNVIIKADVQGSVDVLRKSVGEVPTEKVQLRVLHAAVGAISEADIHLAQASEAIVIGFHIVADDRARQLADQLGVEVRLYRVIYEIIDDMRKALAGLLEPIRREEVRGAAEVRQVFNISRVGTVAGCYVTSGTIARANHVRLVRDGRPVVERASLESLKRFKDDAREVRAGVECGIKLDGYNDIKPGDVIEAYEIVEELQEL